MRRSAPLAMFVGLVACSSPVAPTDAPPTASGSPAPTAAPTATTGATSAPTATGWERLDDAPFARLEMAVAAHEGRIWLAGGLSPTGEALSDVEIFDPGSGAWSDGPALPTGIHHAALVSDGERLLLVGGYIGSDFSQPTDLALVLEDPAAGWTEGPRLPEARAAGAAAFDGARVVYAGGVAPSGVVADAFVLGPAGDAWERIGTMRRAREHLAATSDGEGTVWLMGGRAGGLTSNMADVEIVTADGIDAVASVPTPRGGVAAFHVAEHGACLTGGEAPDRAFTDVECVAADGSVTTLPALNEPHHGHGVAVVDGIAYVLLGGPEPTLSAGSTIEALRLDP